MRTVLAGVCVCLGTIGLAASGLAASQDVVAEPYKPGTGMTAPVMTKEVKPVYPRRAMSAREQGSVKLECVVKADGSVGTVRVLRGLAPDLNEAAIKALEQWTFTPGTKEGRAVPVIVEVEIAFTLRDRGPRLGSPEVFALGPGVVSPRLLKEAKPVYPTEAKQSGIQGVVFMDCVVLPDGSVGDVRVTRPLHPQLDAEAIRTLGQWRFRAGEKDGKAVPVQVMVEMSFTLR